ncbi:MAG: hypothetical protein ACI906_001440 [Candidatus Latescibacterota bacterium]|jgi:hypothetical protein
MIVDAYCHVGLPRFGSLEDALTVAQVFGVERSVLVLGPMVPDYVTLFRAIAAYPDTLRGVGIPFGENEAQQGEIAEIQLRAGIAGLRLSASEILQYPAVPELVGQSGRWIYAVSIIDNSAAAEYLVDWLERYPACRVAAPHFLCVSDGGISSPLAELISHPRFYPIFSRHGGLGSQESYPHMDFVPWVESVVALCGWQRAMFGSEYPVIFWRDETYASCLDWVREIQPQASAIELAGLFGDTANQLLFEETQPAREEVVVPPWVGEQFDRNRTVPLWDGREVPMDAIQDWLELYVEELKEERAALFSRSKGNKT